jgi:hypothetical protein
LRAAKVVVAAEMDLMGAPSDSFRFLDESSRNAALKVKFICEAMKYFDGSTGKPRSWRYKPRLPSKDSKEIKKWNLTGRKDEFLGIQ